MIIHQCWVKEEESRMASEKLAKGSPCNVRATREDDTSTVCRNRLVVDQLLVPDNQTSPRP